MIRYDEAKHLFFSTLITDDRFISGFSDKFFGDCRKTSTLLSYLVSNAIPFRTLISPAQIHSVNISVISPSHSPEKIIRIDDTDGIVTKERQIVLSVITADCVPIVFADKKRGIVGVSHQGWRGSLKRLPQKMVKIMKSLGSEPRDIVAAIGPSIGPCCYDIDEERYAAFMEEFSPGLEDIVRFHHGRPYLNLAYLSYRLLLGTGLEKKHIDFFPFCTSCDRRRFFSFRRDSKKNYGEMVAFICYD